MAQSTKASKYRQLIWGQMQKRDSIAALVFLQRRIAASPAFAEILDRALGYQGDLVHTEYLPLDDKKNQKGNARLFLGKYKGRPGNQGKTGKELGVDPYTWFRMGPMADARTLREVPVSYLDWLLGDPVLTDRKGNVLTNPDGSVKQIVLYGYLKKHIELYLSQVSEADKAHLDEIPFDTKGFMPSEGFGGVHEMAYVLDDGTIQICRKVKKPSAWSMRDPNLANEDERINQKLGLPTMGELKEDQQRYRVFGPMKRANWKFEPEQDAMALNGDINLWDQITKFLDQIEEARDKDRLRELRLQIAGYGKKRKIPEKFKALLQEGYTKRWEELEVQLENQTDRPQKLVFGEDEPKGRMQQHGLRMDLYQEPKNEQGPLPVAEHPELDEQEALTQWLLSWRTDRDVKRARTTRKRQDRMRRKYRKFVRHSTLTGNDIAAMEVLTEGIDGTFPSTNHLSALVDAITVAALQV